VKSRATLSFIRKGVLAVVVVFASAAAPADATVPGVNGRIFGGDGQHTFSMCPTQPSREFERFYALTPDVSPDGTLLAFRGGPGPDTSTWGIFTRNLVTGVETRISGTGGIVTTDEDTIPGEKEGRFLGWPSFSPDGKKLAVMHSWSERDHLNRLVFRARPAIIDLQSGAFTPLGSKDPSVGNVAYHGGGGPLAWANDGSGIFVPLDSEENGIHRVRLFRYDTSGGGGPTVINPTENYGYVDAAPTGDRLLVQKLEPAGLTGDSEYYADAGRAMTMTYNGDDEQPIGPAAATYGIFSPDGQKMAYARSDDDSIHIVGVDGAGDYDTSVRLLDFSLSAWSTNTKNCSADDFGGMRVNEVMTRHGGSADAQFVELLGAADHPFPAADGPYGIRVLDAGDTAIAEHTFPPEFLPGKDTSKELLFATEAAETALGTSSDYDFGVPLSLPSEAGRVCFTAKGAEVSCVAYGCVASQALPKTDYAPAPPDGRSIQRQGITATVWQVGSPTPKLPNAPGAAAQNCLPPPDADGDGSPDAQDCDDANAAINPDAVEVLDNSVDEDCDGVAARSATAFDMDGDGFPDTTDACPAVPGPASGCPPVPPGLRPTDGNDRLSGTDAGETICGLLGADIIDAMGGDDIVFGDACSVKTRSGSFRAVAGGDDSLDGGAGDDSLYGAGGADKIAGGDGNDNLFGGGGKDRLNGGNNNDKLNGGAGANSYKGGAGNDAIVARNRATETVNCGSGRKDSATVDKADKVKGCEKVRRR
jgi:hypothetical protein